MREEAFETFYKYLTIDEPAVHLLPLHFLPLASRGQVGEGVLYELAVAAKFEYARNRRLDEVTDHPDAAPGLSSIHRVNDAFYEVALTAGVVPEALGHAESFFAESARLAGPTFQGWAEYQQACVGQTRLLREDYENLITEA
jgi:hypothetical protein